MCRNTDVLAIQSQANAKLVGPVTGNGFMLDRDIFFSRFCTQWRGIKQEWIEEKETKCDKQSGKKHRKKIELSFSPSPSDPTHSPLRVQRRFVHSPFLVAGPMSPIIRLTGPTRPRWRQTMISSGANQRSGILDFGQSTSTPLRARIECWFRAFSYRSVTAIYRHRFFFFFFRTVIIEYAKRYVATESISTSTVL